MERVRLDIDRTRMGLDVYSVLSWGGIVTVRLGVAALGSPLCLLIVLAFVRVLIVVQTAPEEAVLRSLFGESYLEYSQQVNRWIGRKSRR